MQYLRIPVAGGASQAEVQAAVIAALQAVFATSIKTPPIFHNAALDNITGAFSEAGGVGNGSIPASTKKIQISSIIGKPIQIGIGANSGAAVASINLVSGGGPVYIDYSYTAGDKLFVKTLDASTVTSNNFVINFMG